MARHYKPATFSQEEKEAKEVFEALNEVVSPFTLRESRERGGRYEEDKAEWIPIGNVVVVYSSLFKAFYKISAKRLLEKNYKSAMRLTEGRQLMQAMRRMERMEHFPDEERWEKNLLVFGLDDYEKDFPHNRFDEFQKNYDVGKMHRIMYAITYSQNPLFEKLLDYKLYRAVEKVTIDGINEGTTLEETLQGFATLPKKAQKLIQSKNFGYWEIQDLVHTYKRLSLTNEQFEYFLVHAKPYSLSCLCSIILDNKETYTMDNLIAYLRRCEMYQALPPSQAISQLDNYLHLCKKYHYPINYFPSSLAKEERKVRHVDEKYADALYFEEAKRLMNEDTTLDEYIFEDENYRAVPEHDIEHVKEMPGFFGRLQGADYRRLFWVIDKKTNLEQLSVCLNHEYERFGFNVYGYNRRTRLTKKEKSFLKKWMNHNRLKNLSLRYA